MTKKRFFKYGIFALMAVYVLINGSLVNLIKNRLKIRQMKEEIRLLDEIYNSQLSEKEKIDEDNAEIEEMARLKLNMVKPGEIEFRFDPPK